MPLYQYECDLCHHRFEIIQKLSDPPADRCPKCGGAVHKMQSAPAFQFKGTGWYVTDYARKDAAGGKSEAAAKPDAKESSGDAGEKSDKSDKPSADAAKAAASTASTPSTTKST